METSVTSVTEPPAETEETTAPETETTSETEETENSDIELLSLFDDSTITQESGLPTKSGSYTLGESITEADSWTIPTGENIDLDLNGNNLTFASGKNINIQTGASLTIHSTSNAQMNFSHDGEYVCIINNGNLTLSGNVVLYGMLTNTMWGLWLVKNVNGSFTLGNSAKLIRGQAGGGGTIDSDGGTTTIDGGKIENEKGSGLSIKNCQFTMNNGNINVPGDIMSCDNSTVNITNSTMIGSGKGVELINNSTFKMVGGKLQAANFTIVNKGGYVELTGDFNVSVMQPHSDRVCITNSNNGTVVIKGGTITGNNGINSSSGKVTVENTQISANKGNGIVVNGGNITVNNSTITSNEGYGISCGEGVDDVELGDSTICGMRGGSDGSIKSDNSSNSVFVTGQTSVDNDGNVTLNGGCKVTKGGSPEVTLPQGGKVSKDGTVNAPKAQIGDTAITTKDGNIEFDDDGNIQVDSDDTVQIGGTEVTLPEGGTIGEGGSVSAHSAKIGDTTVTSKDGNVNFNNEGGIEVQSGDTVQVKDTTVTLPDGGTVDNSGKVTADELQVGDVTVKGKGSTVSPDGNIKVSDGGTVQKGSGPEVTLPEGGTVDGSGNVDTKKAQIGDTVITSESGVKFNNEGDIEVQSGDTVLVGGTEVTVPQGGTLGGDGSVITKKVQIGKTVVTSESEIQFNTKGEIEVQSVDNVQVGDTQVILPKGGTVDKSGKVTAEELQVGGFTITGEGSTIDTDGNISTPNGGTVIFYGDPGTDGITIITSTDDPIQIKGQLGSDVKCKVQLGELGGTGLFAVMDDENYASADNFISADGCTVVKNGKELYFTNHVHEDGTAFAPWTDTESLPDTAGSWYLTENVNLSDTWSVPAGEVNLCLNGHDVNGQIILNTTSTINIYDCQETAGKITSSATWGTIFINSSDSTVSIYGGNIKNTGTGGGFGEGTAVYNCGSLNIYGGNISGNNYAVINTSGDGITVVGGTMTGGNYGIWFENKNIDFSLSGSPIISGAYADIYLKFGKINIIGELTGKYTIGTENDGVFTSGAKGKATAANFIPSAELQEKGYEVTVTEDGELALTLKEYTITYLPGTDGTGEVEQTTKTHDESAALSSDKFTRLGYTQVGWTETENGAKKYDLGAEYKDDKDITLYPVWEKNIITLSPAKAYLKVDDTTSITAAVSPDTAVYDPIEWKVTDGDSDVIKFTVSTDGMSVDITTLKAGEVTLTAFTDGGETTAECQINVTRTDSTVTPSADDTVTYGNELTLTAEVNKISKISLMSVGLDEVEFFNDEISLGSAEVTDGKAELTVNVTKDKFGIGENKIKAVYGGSISLNGSESSEITVNVEKRTLTPSINGTTFEKVYDGNDSADGLGISIALDNVVSGDDVTANGKFTFDSANVKEAKTITADNITLDGADAEYYVLSETSLTHDGTITPVNIEIPASEYTYDGETVRKIEIDGVNGEKVTATLTAYSKNAGTYTYDVTSSSGKYTAGLSSTNYAISTAGTLTIKQLTAEIKWQNETSFVYNGTEKTVAAEVTNAVDGDTFNIEYDGNTAANVGEYTAEILSLGNNNYSLGDNTSLKWKISAAVSESTNAEINYKNETISTNSKMEYSLDGENYFPCTENMSVTEFEWDGSESITVMFRYAADQNHSAGAVQTVVIPKRPAAPDISGMTVTKTQNSITVTGITNCEYSIDGTTWQDSGTFTGLTAGKEYTVHIRTKATENAFASFIAEKSIVTSDNSSGTTELKTGETVKTENGSITNDGKNVEIEDKNGQKTTVTLPDGASDSVEVDESGNVQVPDDSIVQTGNTTVELPDGGTVKPDGTIIADKVVAGNTTVSGDEVTVKPDGNIALPIGGKVSYEGSETVIGEDGSIKNDEVSIEPVDNVDYLDENGENYSLNNGYIVLDIEDNTKQVSDLSSSSDTSVRAAYDIRLLYNGEFEVEPTGTVKVTMDAPEGADGTEKVLHQSGNGFEDMNAEYDSNLNTFSFETDHFSIYVIAVPSESSVSPGNTDPTDEPVDNNNGNNNSNNNNNNSSNNNNNSSSGGTPTAPKEQTKLINISVDNKINGKTSVVISRMSDNVITAELGKEFNGLFANVFTEGGDLIYASEIKDGIIKFTYTKDEKLVIVIDSISYAEDLTAGAGEFSSESEIVENSGVKTAVCISIIFAAAIMTGIVLKKKKAIKIWKPMPRFTRSK